MQLKALIFDLDDTLLDTSGILVPIFGTTAYQDRILKPLPLIDHALENLELLSKKYHLSLVTQGKPVIQKSKIESLGVRTFFSQIEIIDLESGGNKLLAFEKICKITALDPQNFLSIGNRISTDIRPAKRLGMFTCLFRHGEHQNELPEGPEDIPDFQVSSHHDLISVCKL